MCNTTMAYSGRMRMAFPGQQKYIACLGDPITDLTEDMANEEFQKLVLEKLVLMETEIKDVKANMVTKADVEYIVSEQQKNVKAIPEIILEKTERMETKMNLLEQRTFENETDLQLLKKAK